MQIKEKLELLHLEMM